MSKKIDKFYDAMVIFNSMFDHYSEKLKELDKDYYEKFRMINEQINNLYKLSLENAGLRHSYGNISMLAKMYRDAQKKVVHC